MHPSIDQLSFLCRAVAMYRLDDTETRAPKEDAMSRVDRVVEEMPEKEARMVYLERARALEAQLKGERVITMARCGFPFGTLVVTDRRLIVLLQDSEGVQVIPYRDISAVEVISGSRGALGLGSRKSATLVVRYRNGRSRDAISLGRDGDWGYEVGRVIAERHQNFSLRDS